MMDYPLAVISPWIGTLSETFIFRHMTNLLPGKTVVVAIDKVSDSLDAEYPHFLLSSYQRDYRWFYRGICHYFKLNKLSPVQMAVRDYLKKNGVQVVLSEYLDISLRWIDVAKSLGIKFFAHAHGYDISKSLCNPKVCQSYQRLNEIDGIITMSELSRKKLIDLGLKAEKIYSIPYGVDVPVDFNHVYSKKTIRCLAVGRMVGKKSPLNTLKAFHKALETCPHLNLDYVGDGALFENAKKYVFNNGLNKNIILHGSKSNSTVQTLMKSADIFLQHSMTDPATGDEEGLPVAILEAMANGLPVISTRHAGIPEAVIQGKTGFLTDEGDVEGMASLIVKLSIDKQLRYQLGKSGWNRAKKNFSWEKEKASLLGTLGLINYIDA